MKQSIAILLIIIHLFNIVGYYGLFSRLEILNNEEVADRLDDDHYSGSDAITLRLPFSSPYLSHQDTYERIEGKFNYEGAMYRLVKQKLYNDTLYVICVKDHKGTLIEDAFEDLASSLIDNPHHGKQLPKVSSLSIKDYETPVEIAFTHKTYAVSEPLFSSCTFSETFNLIFAIDHPPRA